MDLGYLLYIFRSRWALVAAFTVACAGAGLAAGLLLRDHSSTATLLIRSPLVDAEGSRRGGASSPTATALEVLASPRVAKQVVTRARLTLDHPHVQGWRPPADLNLDTADWLAAQLLKSTRFSSTADSNVIAVTAYSADRRTAAELANGFVEAYLDVSRELQTGQARSRLLQSEKGLPGVDAEVAAARDKLAAFRRGHPGFNADPRSDSAPSAIALLSQQLAQAESEPAVGGGADGLQAEDTQLAPLQTLQADVRRSRARLTEVSANYGENHPLHASAKAEYEQAQESLRRAGERVVKAGNSKSATIREAIRRQEGRSLNSAALHEEYSALQRVLASAEAAAATVRGSLRQASIEAEAAVATASVLAYAVPQAVRASDPLRRALPIGAAVGLLLGSIAALLAEEMFPRFRRVGGAMAALGLRLLAQVPAAAQGKRRRLREERHETVPEVTDGRAEPVVTTALARSQAPDLLGRILVEHGTITPGQAVQIAEGQERLKMPFGQAGVKLGFLSQGEVDRALSSQFGFHRMAHAQGASRSLIVNENPEHPVAEAIRGLRSQLLLEWRRSGITRPISVHSLLPGEGKSFVASNLAIAFAQANFRTVLVDLNLREPHLHTLFGVPGHSGISKMLAGLEAGETTRPIDALGKLALIPAGPRPPNPQELISGPGLAALVDGLAGRFDVVILDAPSWSAGADAQLVAATSDVVLVARADRTPLNGLLEMRAELDRMQVQIIGAVSNEC